MKLLSYSGQDPVVLSKDRQYRSVEQIREPQIDWHNCGWQKRAKTIQLN